MCSELRAQRAGSRPSLADDPRKKAADRRRASGASVWLRRKEEWETPRGRRQARPAGQAPSRGQHACCAPVKEKGTRLRFESPRADARKGRRRRGRPREHIGEGGAHQGGACGAMEPTSRTHATRERARGRRGSTPCCSSLPRRPQRRVHLRHQAGMGYSARDVVPCLLFPPRASFAVVDCATARISCVAAARWKASDNVCAQSSGRHSLSTYRISYDVQPYRQRAQVSGDGAGGLGGPRVCAAARRVDYLLERDGVMHMLRYMPCRRTPLPARAPRSPAAAAARRPPPRCPSRRVRPPRPGLRRREPARTDRETPETTDRISPLNMNHDRYF